MGKGKKVNKRYKLPAISPRGVVHSTMTRAMPRGNFNEILRIFITRRKIFFLLSFLLFLLHRYDVMDASQTYCANHFTVHVNQTVVLDPLKLYNNMCLVLLNKIGKNNNSAWGRPTNIFVLETEQAAVIQSSWPGLSRATRVTQPDQVTDKALSVWMGGVMTRTSEPARPVRTL